MPADGAEAGMPGFAHRHAQVNGTRIHYVAGGQGPAVVLLHGWPDTWALWRKLMPRLADAGFTVIAPDLRGLGDFARAETGYTKTNVAEDVRQVVQSLGLNTIHLVGTDIGTMVAYAYAANHPEEVRRLVLAESVLPGFGLEELMNPVKGGYWHFGFHLQVDLAEMLTAGKEAAYLLPTMRMMSISPDAAPGGEDLVSAVLRGSGWDARRLSALRHAARRREGKPGILPFQADDACPGAQRPTRHSPRTDIGERPLGRRERHGCVDPRKWSCLRARQSYVGGRTIDPVLPIRLKTSNATLIKSRLHP